MRYWTRNQKKVTKLSNRFFQSEGEICTTVINIHEILYGLHKYGKPVKEILLLPVLNYTKKDAVLSSKIELKQKKEELPYAELMP